MTIYSDAIPDGWMGLDIGRKDPASCSPSRLSGAGTVVWNGPMGVSEWKNFAAGTERDCKGGCRMRRAISIIGGGDCCGSG